MCSLRGTNYSVQFNTDDVVFKNKNLKYWIYMFEYKKVVEMSRINVFLQFYYHAGFEDIFLVILKT